jgi:hypothetical protein
MTHTTGMQGRKNQCPPGYVCPYYAETGPTKCQNDPHHNTTCFHESLSYQPGLAAPRRCPGIYHFPSTRSTVCMRLHGCQ